MSLSLRVMLWSALVALPALAQEMGLDLSDAPQCKVDKDCAKGQRCRAGACVARPKKPAEKKPPPAETGAAAEPAVEKPAEKPVEKPAEKPADKPADAPTAAEPAGDVGLDLSEGTVAAEYRPTLAVLGATAADADETSPERAKLILQEVLRQAGEGDQFKMVMGPDVAEKQLGQDWAAAKACATWDCFEKVAKTLKVHRVLLATVHREGAGSAVTMMSFDPGFSQLSTTTQESQEKAERKFAGLGGKSQATKDREFMKKMTGFVKTTLKGLATGNGKIVVDNLDGSVAVLIDGAEAGSGAFDAVVQRGAHVVKVASARYEPFEETVTVAPGKAVTVRVALRAKALERSLASQQTAPAGPSVFARPGLYVAVAGLAAAGVGIALGQVAQATAAKAKTPDADGVVPLTRAQANGAKTDALLANVLVAAGGAMVAGGTIWVILTPTVRPAERPTDGAPSEGAGFGFAVMAGGTF